MKIIATLINILILIIEGALYTCRVIRCHYKRTNERMAYGDTRMALMEIRLFVAYYVS